MPRIRSGQISEIRQGSARGGFGSDERSITEMNSSLAETLSLQTTIARCAFCDWEGVEGTMEECRLASIDHRKKFHPRVEHARQKTADRKASRIAKLKAKTPIEEPLPVVVEPPAEPVPPSGPFAMLRLRVDAVTSMPSDKRPRWTLGDAKAVDELLVRVAGE